MAIAEIMEGYTEKAVKVLKVIGINDKTSRFNHSCWPKKTRKMQTRNQWLQGALQTWKGTIHILRQHIIGLFLTHQLLPCSFTGPKFFEPAQKFIYLLCQSQTFCARQKNRLHSVKLFFVLAQKFLKRHQMQSNFWAGSKNLDRPKTFWDL